MDRALELRDAIHLALNQKQNNDLRDDALSTLDVLVSFMSAVDIAAQVPTAFSGSTARLAPGRSARNSWRQECHAPEPTLADVVADGTAGNHVLTIVRLLRNSVHGTALQGIAYTQDHGPQETLVGLPAGEEAELLAAMDAEGGRSLWGTRAVVLAAPTLIQEGSWNDFSKP